MGKNSVIPSTMPSRIDFANSFIMAVPQVIFCGYKAYRLSIYKTLIKQESTQSFGTHSKGAEHMSAAY
jgi:hypothetical protein